MFDVVIIGAGVTGSAIAREVSRYKLNTCVIEMLTILVGDFSNSKAFADKTVEAFFVFARNFEMAIGEKLNSS